MQASRSPNPRVVGDLAAQLDTVSPYGGFAYVTVTFTNADADTLVEHPLRPRDPEALQYQVVGSNAPTLVYHDHSAMRRAWVPGGMVLRASAPATVRLLITLPPLG